MCEAVGRSNLPLNGTSQLDQCLPLKQETASLSFDFAENRSAQDARSDIINDYPNRLHAMTRLLTLLLALNLWLSACAPSQPDLETRPGAESPDSSPQPTLANTVTHTASPTVTESPTETPSPTPSDTPTPEPTATYAILRGRVNVERVSCRYGPGAMYLYLYGMLQGATQDVIGRNDDGSWALTQSRGDATTCWVRADLMDLNGDILSVAPIHPDDYRLPMSPYYGPLTGVSATRSDDQVTIAWHPLILRPGDDSEQTPYVLQIWACRDGEIVMQSIGAYQATASVTDESGCPDPSRGRITAAEKHGYTKFVEIPWP
jgi:hypothetical protein